MTEMILEERLPLLVPCDMLLMQSVYGSFESDLRLTLLCGCPEPQWHGQGHH